MVQYPSVVQILDQFINIFHVFIPFSINCISALIVITTAARTRLNSEKKQSFKEHLCEQLQHHKHLLISPSVLVVLTLPRLMRSFLVLSYWIFYFIYFINHDICFTFTDVQKSIQ